MALLFTQLLRRVGGTGALSSTSTPFASPFCLCSTKCFPSLSHVAVFAKHFSNAQKQDVSEVSYESSLSRQMMGHLKSVALKYDQLQKAMEEATTSGAREKIRDLARETNLLSPIAEGVRDLEKKNQEYNELQSMLQEAINDPQMVAMIKEDTRRCLEEIHPIEKTLLLNLIPPDHYDIGNAILEVRAGTGGSEAQLFAKEMFEMYETYAEKKGWKFKFLSSQTTEVGGYREASAAISGKGVFGRLKYESGVHRVQRVPETESLGRVHTSTMTVAILPEVTEVDVTIHPKDLRIDLYRSSGNGGQSVNTTDSAVRITHIPTGTVVCMQDERSQLKNKEKAMQILRGRLYEKQREKLHSERSAARSEQIGTGSRSERIRTYNFSQNRVTDHRVNVASHSLDSILKGDDLDYFLDDVISNFQARELDELTKAPPPPHTGSHETYDD